MNINHFEYSLIFIFLNIRCNIYQQTPLIQLNEYVEKPSISNSSRIQIFTVGILWTMKIIVFTSQSFKCGIVVKNFKCRLIEPINTEGRFARGHQDRVFKTNIIKNLDSTLLDPIPIIEPYTTMLLLTPIMVIKLNHILS